MSHLNHKESLFYFEIPNHGAHAKVARNQHEDPHSCRFMLWDLLVMLGVEPRWSLYNEQIVHSHALITPKFMSGSSREIVGDYVEK